MSAGATAAFSLHRSPSAQAAALQPMASRASAAYTESTTKPPANSSARPTTFATASTCTGCTANSAPATSPPVVSAHRRGGPATATAAARCHSRFGAGNQPAPSSMRSRAKAAMMSGRYRWPPRSGGQYGAPKARQTPAGSATSGFVTMIATSSIANWFQSAPRYTTMAHPATTAYSCLVPTIHLEHRAAAAPSVDDREPARICAEQRVQLGGGFGHVAGDHDVGYALPLQVRPLLGRGGQGHFAAVVAVNVQGHTRAARMKPEQRLEVRGHHGVGRESPEPRQHLAGAGRNQGRRGAPSLRHQPLDFESAVAGDDRAGHDCQRDAQGPKRGALPETNCGRDPGEAQPGKHDPKEPIDGEGPDGQDGGVTEQCAADARPAGGVAQAAHQQRPAASGAEGSETRPSRQPRERQVAQRARQVAQAGPEGAEAGLLQRLEIAAIARGHVGIDPAAVTDEPQSPRQGGGEDGANRQRRSPPRRAADEHQIEDAPRSHRDAAGTSEPSD